MSTNPKPEQITPTETKLDEAQSAPKNMGSKKTMIIVLIVFLLLMFIGALVFVIIFFSGIIMGGNNNTNVTPTVTPTIEVTITPTTDNIIFTSTPILTLTPSTRPTTHASNPTPTSTPEPFRVTAVNITPDLYCKEYDGGSGYPYLTEFTFTGTITANGAGTVTYKWQPNPFYLITTQTLVFTKAETKAINPSTVGLAIDNWQVDYAYGSNYVKVFTPNAVDSNVVNVVLNNNRGDVHPCP